MVTIVSKAVDAEQDSDHIFCAVRISKYVIENKSGLHECSSDRINGNKLPTHTKSNCQTKDNKSRHVTRHWFSEPVNQARLVKNTTTKIWQQSQKNRIRNEEEEIAVKLEDK